MKNKFKLTGKIKYMIIVLICILLFSISFVTKTGTSFIRGIASYTIIPIQKGISGVSGFIGSKLGKFESYEQLQEENTQLRKQVDTLNVLNQNLSKSEDELKRFQSLYNLKQYYSEYETVGASIIGRDDTSWFNTFVLDKGSKDGIKKDMNVITQGGLVGIVTMVGTNYCNVRAIIDDSSNVSAQDNSTKDLCIVKGDTSLIQEGRIYFDQMDNNENEVKVGDEIVTSQISNKFIPGILIGTIAEVKVSPNNLTRYGYITPTVDFSDIREVLIVTTLKDNGKGEVK